MKKVIFSAVLGFISLAAVNLTAGFTGVYLPVTRLSLAASGALGISGVTLMVILSALF